MVGFKFLVDIEIIQGCLKEANECFGLKYTSIYTKESETKREKSRCDTPPNLAGYFVQRSKSKQYFKHPSLK